MVYVASVGVGLPETTLSQMDAKQLVQDIFHTKQHKVNRLLPVFDNANILSRQLVTNVEWYKKKRSFSERNNLYINKSTELAVKAIDNCLAQRHINNAISTEQIDLIVFVSSTGIATPSLDAHIMNKRPFKETTARMPLWGLGCAGGAVGLRRAIDWLQSYPTKTALVICSELCSLTFQQDDDSTSNIVGTALFGDGVSATLLFGKESQHCHLLPKHRLTFAAGSSYLQ